MVICHERREYIDPGDIGDEVNVDGAGVKLGPLVLMHCMNIVGLYAASGPWHSASIRVVGDGGSEYDEADEHYTNVTRDALQLFVQDFPEFAEKWKLRHVGDVDMVDAPAMLTPKKENGS